MLAVLAGDRAGEFPAPWFFVRHALKFAWPLGALLAGVEPAGEYDSLRERTPLALGCGVVKHPVVDQQFPARIDVELNVVDPLVGGERSAAAVGAAHMRHIRRRRLPLVL